MNPKYSQIIFQAILRMIPLIDHHWWQAVRLLQIIENRWGTEISLKVVGDARKSLKHKDLYG